MGTALRGRVRTGPILANTRDLSSRATAKKFYKLLAPLMNDLSGRNPAQARMSTNGNCSLDFGCRPDSMSENHYGPSMAFLGKATSQIDLQR